MPEHVLTQPTGTYLTSIPAHLLCEPRDNPNRMSEVVFQRLRRGISREGLNTTILARELDGGLYEIVDGCHRVKAARELGIQEIPAWVYPLGSCDDRKAKALQIGFNAITGEPDLTAVAGALAEYDLVGSDLLELAGYGPGDAQALLDALQPPELDLEGAGCPAPVESQPDDAPAKVFELKLVFSSAEQLAAVRKVLRKSAGKGRDMADGLVKLVGLE